MRIFDGKHAILGRMAAQVAKELLKGEEVVVVNCEEVLISGNKEKIKEDFERFRKMGSHSQKGPAHHKSSEKMVKRVTRGMLPNHRFGKGRDAFKRLRCYNKIPEEFEKSEKITFKKGKQIKTSRIKEFE